MRLEDQNLVEFATELANTSRNVILDACKSAPEINIKSDLSLVTDTDISVEALLCEMIGDRFPHHGIIGEELGSHNAGSDHVWVLDPIDGTAQFVAGLPVYGTLIGMARNGRPYLGVIDLPATNDRWIGCTAAGTWRNGLMQRTRGCGGLDAAFATNSNPDFMDEFERTRLDKIRRQVRYVQYGGSCFSYGLLASGRTDMAVDSGFDIFDMLAPAAVIEAAGGVVSDWNGDSIDLSWRGRVVAVGDPSLHGDVCRLLK